MMTESTKVECCARYCKKSSQKHPNLSFYFFPQDPILCRKWVTNSGWESLMYGKDITSTFKEKYLCSNHFNPEQYVTFNKKKSLSLDAVPTIFDRRISVDRSANAKVVARQPSSKFSHHDQALGGSSTSKTSESGNDRLLHSTKPVKRRKMLMTETTLKQFNIENVLVKGETNNLWKKNMFLSKKLGELMENRKQTMSQIQELEARLENIRKFAGINVDLLQLTVSDKNRPHAAEEFDKLSAITQLLMEEEEDDSGEEVVDGDIEERYLT